MNLSDCHACFLRNSARQPVPGEGRKDARLILIGECPGHWEDLKRRPFVGEAGKLLDHILGRMGISRTDIYITNVLKCRPPNNKLPTGEKLEECIKACHDWLADELNMFFDSHCSYVLLGATALCAFIDHHLISKHEGQEVAPKTWAALHPAFALRRPGKEINIYRTIYRAAKQAGLKPKRMGWKAGMFHYKERR